MGISFHISQLSGSQHDLNSRVVHIEVIVSMERDSFICALRRFFAIRGVPEILRCDQGANFIGAKSELDKAMNELDDNLAVVTSRLKSVNRELKMRQRACTTRPCDREKLGEYRVGVVTAKAIKILNLIQRHQWQREK